MVMLSKEAEAEVIAQTNARLAQQAAIAENAKKYGEIRQTPSGLEGFLSDLRGRANENVLTASSPELTLLGKAYRGLENYYNNSSALDMAGDAVSLGAALLPATAAYRVGLAGIMKTPQLAAAGRKFMNDAITGLARQELEDYVINNALSGTPQNVAKTVDTVGDTTRTVNAIRKLVR